MALDSSLDWRFGDDETFRQNAPTPTPAPRRRLRLPWLPRLLLILASLALLSGVTIWRMAAVRHERLLADAQAAVDLELAALLNGEPGVSAWDETADRLWQTRYVAYVRGWARSNRPQSASARVLDAELVPPNLALVTVETSYQQNDALHTVRQVRVYRLQDRQWLRTSVDDRVWGPWEVYETGHFRFVYHQRDAGLIREVAQGSDVFYEQVYRDLGAPLPSTRPLTVQLDVYSPTLDAVRTEDGMRITSPLITFTGLDTAETASQNVRWRLASTFVNLVAADANLAPARGWRILTLTVLNAEASLFAAYPPAGKAAAYARLARAQREQRLVPLAALETSNTDPDLILAEYLALGDYVISRFGPNAPG
ncbi:MAG: hypothetical protein KIT87_08455, partial [Anaerolineae bacterium]|nr:hypothetical protein [Anaerolineae bacterium]